MDVRGWTPQSWESAMKGILETAAKKKRKHKYQPKGGRKGAPCLICGLGQAAATHDTDDAGQPEDEPVENDAKAPPASHRTCKNCGAHMAKDAGSCPSCGTKWASSDALDD